MFDGWSPSIERRHKISGLREYLFERDEFGCQQRKKRRRKREDSKPIIMQRILNPNKCLIDRLIVCIFILVVSLLQFNAFALIDELDKTTISNNSAQFATSQSVSSNMSSMILNQQAGPTMMTNASLSLPVNKTVTYTNASSNSPTASFGRSVQVGGAKSALHMAANRQGGAAPPTNSPAFISRLKQSAPQTKQQVDNSFNQQTRAGKRTDNQMAADNTHENQAFMSINSGATTISEPSSIRTGSQLGQKDEAHSAGADQQAGPNKQAASALIELGTEPTGRHGSDSSMSTSTNPKSAPTQQQQVAKASAAGNRQTSHWLASVASPPGQWRSKATTGGGHSSSASRTYQVQFDSPTTHQQQRYTGGSPDQLADSDGLSMQVEKPSGYSYEPAASPGSLYTHTSPLSPARQELQVAEQVRLRQQHRQPSQYYQQQQQHYYDRSPHSSPIFDTSPRSVSAVESQIQQQQQHISGGSISKLASQQIDQFNSVQQQLQIDGPLSSGGQTSGGRQPSAAKPHGDGHYPTFSMMPVPHLTITGTAGNPCKPPPGSLVGGTNELGQASIQILAGESAQALPNFSNELGVPQSGSPKYHRSGYGTRLRSQYIFKVIRADSLTDCELACQRSATAAGNNMADLCRSFNYRAHFAAENCELSRYDIRSLKLEDSAQFEQNTQFDFYSLETAPAAAAAIGPTSGLVASASMMASPSGSSVAYSPFPEADCLDVSQSCNQDGMEFTLRTTEPFNGRIYTYGFYDSCFTDGEGSTTSVLRVTRSNGFPRCGTQQIGDLMTNIVVVQFNDYVQTTRDKKYNLTCYFSGPGEAVVTSNYLDTKIDERSHPIQIEHLPPQNVITSNVHLRVLYRGQPTNTIAVGDLLTFRLETRALSGHQHRAEHAQQQNEIFASNVIAKDPYSGRQVQLIDARGCPIDPTNVFPELQRTPDGALESEFYAFKIPDSNFLIFQATVRTCKAPCEPVICQTTSRVGQSAPSGALLSGQYMPLLNGIKGAHQYQMQHQLQQVQLHSVPSWGRRRRRRWTLNSGSQLREAASFHDEASAEHDSDSELLSSGETIEHVIPVRMGASGGERQISAPPREIKTLRRPELSEAEEEVKEMFRVYLSRAEIERHQQRERQKQKQQHRQQLDQVDATPNWPSSSPLYAANYSQDGRPLNSALEQYSSLVGTLNGGTVGQVSAASANQASSATGEQVCLTQSGYYIMLFTVVALSCILLAVLLVSLYITKRAKFHLSDSMSDAIF